MPRKPAPSTTSLLARLDPGDSLPLHRQLYEEIRGAIVRGVLAPGERIPSSRGLAEDLRVSRTTVLQALDQLRAEGYLSSLVGSGTRVADVLPESLTRVGVPSAQAADGPPGSLSRRGEAVAGIPRAVFRVGAEPRAFRLGIPGLDLFPRKLWNRLLIRRARLTSVPELDYGRPGGLPTLRETIAAYVASARGVRCRPEQVIVVGGVQHGVAFAARLLLDPGDAAWLEEPGYLAVRSALTAASARIVPVRVDEEGIDVAEGKRRAPDARLVCITPSHQYPLGVTMSLQRRLMLLEWAREANAWIVEDDYDSEFRYGSRPLMAVHGLEGGSRVIYLGTFSKSVFPSLRIGFLVVPENLVEAFSRAALYTEQNPGTLQQLVLADFIREGHFGRHLRRMRRAYEERQNLLIDEVRRELRDVITLQSANAGLHLVAHLPQHLADVAVARAALACGVEVSPLSTHYLEPNPGNGLLLGFAAADAPEIGAGVHRLKQAIATVRREAGAPAASGLPIRSASGTGTQPRSR